MKRASAAQPELGLLAQIGRSHQERVALAEALERIRDRAARELRWYRCKPTRRGLFALTITVIQLGWYESALALAEADHAKLVDRVRARYRLRSAALSA